MLRKAAVAGQFYPSDPGELRGLIEESYLHRLGPGEGPPAAETREKAVAVVSPHAGYVYSGPVAARSFLHVSSMRAPDLAIVVGPNHYGVGSGVATYPEGEWETPLGRVKVDASASRELVDLCDLVSADPGAHRLEHSIEVQLPFLQMIYGGSVPFLPVSLIFQDAVTSKEVSEALAKLASGKRVILVASSDFTHYEAAEAARKKDEALIQKAVEMDLEGFYGTLERLDVTACGYGAIATIMQTARRLGLNKGELLGYANSGDTTGDNLQVVGYGALRFV